MRSINFFNLPHPSSLTRPVTEMSTRSRNKICFGELLYIYTPSPICLHGIVFNYLRTERIVPAGSL
jgi:hypothetical protein